MQKLNSVQFGQGATAQGISVSNNSLKQPQSEVELLLQRMESSLSVLDATVSATWQKLTLVTRGPTNASVPGPDEAEATSESPLGSTLSDFNARIGYAIDNLMRLQDALRV